MSKLSMSYDERTGILRFGKWTMKPIENDIVILNQENKRAVFIDQVVCEQAIENFFYIEEAKHLFNVRAEREKGNDVFTKKTQGTIRG